MLSHIYIYIINEKAYENVVCKKITIKVKLRSELNKKQNKRKISFTDMWVVNFVI